MSNSNGVPPPPLNPSLTTPLSVLRKLLFESFDELEMVTIQSKAIGDYARVKKIPHQLGKLLLELDPSEVYFHIEFITNHTYEVKQWAELWDKGEWNESNAKRVKLKESSINRIQQHEDNKVKRAKRTKLIEVLEDELAVHPGFRAIPIARKQFAHKIADNYKHGQFRDVLKTLGLLEAIIEYENENENENQQ